MTSPVGDRKYLLVLVQFICHHISDKPFQNTVCRNTLFTGGMRQGSYFYGNIIQIDSGRNYQLCGDSFSFPSFDINLFLIEMWIYLFLISGVSVSPCTTSAGKVFPGFLVRWSRILSSVYCVNGKGACEVDCPEWVTPIGICPFRLPRLQSPEKMRTIAFTLMFIRVVFNR